MPQQITQLAAIGNVFRGAVKSLNIKQNQSFNLMSEWARKKLIHMNLKALNHVETLHLRLPKVEKELERNM